MFGRTSKRTSISGRLHVFPRIFRRKFKMSSYVYKVCFCDDDRDDDDEMMMMTTLLSFMA